MKYRKILGYLMLFAGIPLMAYGSYMAFTNATTRDIADGFNVGVVFADVMIATFGGVLCYFGKNLSKLDCRQEEEKH